jgi:hypothetical protein
MKTFLVLVAFVIFGVCAQELEPCTVCTTVVQTLEGLVNQYTTKENLENELVAISAQVCDNLPEMQEKCKSFVSLYGPYAIELLLSDTKSICSVMGMCTQPTYKLVFPRISSNSIIYSFTEENIVSDSLFKYKLFLANPSFLDAKDYILEAHILPVSGCDLTVKITNQTDFVQTEVCKQDIGCKLEIPKPGRGVWYYVTIATKLHSTKASFTFTATEKNDTRGYWVLKEDHHRFSPGRFALIMCLTFSAVCLICVCISRCARSRKIAKRRSFQQQTEPVFVVPEMMVTIEKDPSMMYSHMPLVLPYPTNQGYIQLQQMPLQQ